MSLTRHFTPSDSASSSESERPSVAGQHEQGAVAVQLQQRVAHHIARRDDVGVARDLLPHRGAVLGLRKGAGQHQFFVRVGFQIALHQVQRTLFRRDAAHIQNVAPGFQPVFFANQVAGQRLAHLHRIGDEDGGMTTFAQFHSLSDSTTRSSAYFAATRSPSLR